MHLNNNVGQHPTARESVSRWDTTSPFNSLTYYYMSVLKSAIPVRERRLAEGQNTSTKRNYFLKIIFHSDWHIENTATYFPAFLRKQPLLRWNESSCWESLPPTKHVKYIFLGKKLSRDSSQVENTQWLHCCFHPFFPWKKGNQPASH